MTYLTRRRGFGGTLAGVLGKPRTSDDGEPDYEETAYRASLCPDGYLGTCMDTLIDEASSLWRPIPRQPTSGSKQKESK